MRWRPCLGLLVLGLASLAAACSPDPPRLTVDVVTDFEAGTDFGSVYTRVFRVDDELGNAIYEVADPAPDFGLAQRVAEFEGLSAGPVEVAVALIAGGSVVVQGTAVLDLGGDYALQMVLPRECAGVVCPGPEDDPDWTTCSEGRCVDPRCGPMDSTSCDTDAGDAGTTDTGAADTAPADTGPMICSAGEACDDGDACTHDDRCDGAGGCAGTPITCADDQCTRRTCNGTSSCTVTPASRETLCDDGNPCTLNLCDGAGACVTIPINTDGVQPDPAEYRYRCCGNSIVDVVGNPTHCGGCWINCGGRACNVVGFGVSRCACSASNQQCRDQNGGPTWTCYDHPGDELGWTCNCLSDADCSHGQTCQIVSGLNFCLY